jgi:hypothetical protein
MTDLQIICGGKWNKMNALSSWIIVKMQSVKIYEAKY